MSGTKKVIFNRTGKYANLVVSLPHFDAVKGEPIEIDNDTANFFIDAGACVMLDEKTEKQPDTNNNGYLSVKELKSALDAGGVEYDAKDKRADLVLLFEMMQEAI